MAEAAVLCADSVTAFTLAAHGAVLITGSHAGRLVGQMAIQVGAVGLIASDAGVGKQAAGVMGLDVLDRFGVPGAAVDVWSARIGDGADTRQSGIVNVVNEHAAELGVANGMPARVAAQLMATASTCTPTLSESAGADLDTGGTTIDDGDVRVIALDSAGWINQHHEGAIVITGSHGGIVDGKAVKAAVLAAAFNDAGVGKQRAGVGRLALLDSMRIAGFAVSHQSARIGDSVDTFASGEVSCVNERGADYGIELGATARDAVERILRRTNEERQ